MNNVRARFVNCRCSKITYSATPTRIDKNIRGVNYGNRSERFENYFIRPFVYRCMVGPLTRWFTYGNETRTLCRCVDTRESLRAFRNDRTRRRFSLLWPG